MIIANGTAFDFSIEENGYVFVQMTDGQSTHFDEFPNKFDLLDEFSDEFKMNSVINEISLMNLLKVHNIVIVEFDDLDFDEKYSLAFGGDEDWVIIVDTNFYDLNNVEVDKIVEKLTVCAWNKDVCIIGDKSYVMFVTCHA